MLRGSLGCTMFNRDQHPRKDEGGRDLSIYRFCYPQEVLEPTPHGHQGKTVCDWCIPKEWFCNCCITTDSGWWLSGKGLKPQQDTAPAFMPSHLPQQFAFCQKRKPTFFSLVTLTTHYDGITISGSCIPTSVRTTTYQMPPTYYYLPGPSYGPWSCYHCDESVYLGNTRTALFYYFDLCIGYHGEHGWCSIRNVDNDWLVSWLVCKHQ